MNSTRFTYTKDQVSHISGLLDLNGGSIARVFAIVFPDHCVKGWDDPVLVVDFIERVKKGDILFPK